MSYSYPDIRNDTLWFEPHVNAPISQNSTLTPDVASYLMSFAIPDWQRDKKQNKIDHYANAMNNTALHRAGKEYHGKLYKEEVAQIIVGVEKDEHGNIIMLYLLDGQHTCLAVIQSNQTIHPSLRVVPIKNEAEARHDYFDVIDSALSGRSIDDIIKARGWVKMFGFATANDIKKLNKAVIMLEEHQLLENSSKEEQIMDADVIESRLEKWSPVAKVLFKKIATKNILWGRGKADKKMKNSKLRDDKFVAHFLFLLKFAQDREIVWSFIDGIVKAANDIELFPKGDPRHAVTEWIRSSVDEGYDLRIPDVIIGLSLAWNAYVSTGRGAKGISCDEFPYKAPDSGRPGVEVAGKCKFQDTVARVGISEEIVREVIRDGVEYLK